MVFPLTPKIDAGHFNIVNALFLLFVFSLWKRTFFCNINLLLSLEHFKFGGGARTGCLKLDRLFSFSVKTFYLINIFCLHIPVDFLLKMLSIRNKFMDITNKLSFL